MWPLWYILKLSDHYKSISIETYYDPRRRYVIIPFHKLNKIILKLLLNIGERANQRLHKIKTFTLSNIDIYYHVTVIKCYITTQKMTSVPEWSR